MTPSAMAAGAAPVVALAGVKAGQYIDDSAVTTKVK
jgi:hypothetical protein